MLYLNYASTILKFIVKRVKKWTNGRKGRKNSQMSLLAIRNQALTIANHSKIIL
jgi:hypothetical protein